MSGFEILGVPLDPEVVADFLAQGSDRRQEAEKRMRRGSGPAFRSDPYREAARRLQQLSADAHLREVLSPSGRWLSCTEFGLVWGRAPGTVRRWTSAGRIPGAHQIGTTWLIPATARPPADRRKRTS